MLEYMRTYLLENHDPDWRFEVNGGNYNCYLPTDTPETYITISGNTIVKTGKNVPQGLIDEITTVLNAK